MKKVLLLTILFITSFYVNGQEKTEPQKSFVAKLEMLKLLGAVSNLGYVFEPQFSYHRNRVAYNLTIGLSRVNNEIYRELDYTNKGTYLQGGVQFRVTEGGDEHLRGFFMGFHVNVSDYEETGKLEFPGSYFGDNQARLTQENISTSVAWLFSYKTLIGEHFVMDASWRLAHILGDFDQPEFPVFRVPGAGLTNFLGDRERNHRTTIGWSLKMGYKF
ncbi:hypothetical protein FNH22_21185 [Fulvivirga sp. M361]|uniref:hypothetical protein n=1 Tax=Fulvivirga sp. M361 TaxID=2594266 RepID=UPI001179A880|nr:hypothetical protein [Fulvivirga sp. M361]TRX53027.1 hypothetical protein FNH22_21185 [Fulvivirga sp. M361]